MKSILHSGGDTFGDVGSPTEPKDNEDPNIDNNYSVQKKLDSSTVTITESYPNVGRVTRLPGDPEKQKSKQSRRRFACSTCELKFKTNGTLSNHEFLHTGLKPYSCAVCGVRFALKHYVQKHLTRTHKKKPEAWRNFYTKDKVDSVEKHKNEQLTIDLPANHTLSVLNADEEKIAPEAHPPIELFKCQFCNKKFSLQFNRIQHCKRVHGEKVVKKGDVENNSGITPDIPDVNSDIQNMCSGVINVDSKIMLSVGLDIQKMNSVIENEDIIEQNMDSDSDNMDSDAHNCKLIKIEPSDVEVSESDKQVFESPRRVGDSDIQVNESDIQVNESDIQVNESNIQVNESDIQVNESDIQVNESNIQVNESDIQVGETGMQFYESDKEMQHGESEYQNKAYKIGNTALNAGQDCHDSESSMLGVVLETNCLLDASINSPLMDVGTHFQHREYITTNDDNFPTKKDSQSAAESMTVMPVNPPVLAGEPRKKWCLIAENISLKDAIEFFRVNYPHLPEE